MSNNNCACGSNLEYLDCCGRYIEGGAEAQEPLALMRSRYTAYVLSKVDYLERTMRDWACIDFDRQATLDFCDRVTWHGLKIIATNYNKGEDFGEVEFEARYQKDGSSNVQVIYERSLFNKVSGKWFYTSSVHEQDKV